MDENLKKNIEDLSARIMAFDNWVKDLNRQMHEMVKYYTGFNGMSKYGWINAEDFKPEDERNCLVSWWDHDDELYVEPIRAYWMDDQNRFYILDSDMAFPVVADIWCYWPDLPKERL